MKAKIIRALSLALALILCVCSFTPAFAEEGMPDGYTPIYTAEDLNAIRNNLSGKFALMNDIDLSEYESWEPIGTEQAPFKGEILGNNMSIEGLNVLKTIESINRSAAGLFAFTNGAEIKDLNVHNSKISVLNDNDHFYAIGVVSGVSRNSEFVNCSVSGEIFVRVNGTCSVGGIVGEITDSSFVTKCSNAVSVEVDGKNELYVGGVIGFASSKISVCSNSGKVTVDNSCSPNKEFDTVCVGGICGNMFLSEIDNCYNTGDLFIECVSDNSSAGGIAGNSFSVTNCYSRGIITYSSQSPTETTGGIVGNVEYHFDGMGISEDVKSYIKNCYSLDNCEKILGNTVPEQVDNICFLSEEMMKKQEMFKGFDFDNIWMMGDDGYPVFRTAGDLTDPINELVNAEILYVPLKNRIVFSFGTPSLPDGIVLRLTYADGSTQKAVVTMTDDGCFANGERLSGGFNPAVVSYGILTETLFVGDAQIRIEYKYLVIPPILVIIKGWIASLS